MPNVYFHTILFRVRHIMPKGAISRTFLAPTIAQKMKFSIKAFFIFCAVYSYDLAWTYLKVNLIVLNALPAFSTSAKYFWTFIKTVVSSA